MDDAGLILLFHVPSMWKDPAPLQHNTVALFSLPVPSSVTAVHFLLCSFPPVALPKQAALVGQNPPCLGSQISEVIGNFHLLVGGEKRSGLGPKSLHF